MAEEPTPKGQEEEGLTPPNPAADAAGATGKGTTETPKAEAAGKSGQDDYIARLREEAKASRLAKEAAEAKLKALEDAQLSEADRIKKQLSEYQQKETVWKLEAQELRLKSAVQEAALREGMNPKKLAAAWRLVDPSEISFDAEGQPTAETVSAAIGRVKSEYAELFQQALTDAQSAGNQAAQANAGAATNPLRKTGPAITLESIKSMSGEEFDKLWADGTIPNMLASGQFKKK